MTDLLSTAANRSAIHQLRFHIRSAGESLPLDKLKMAPKWNAAELVAAGAPVQHAHALDAILFPAEQERTTMRISGRITKGEYFKAEHHFQIEFHDLVHEDEAGPVSLILKLDPHDPLAEPVEHWVDGSMLHSRYKFDANDPDRFDFDWLFGADGSDDTELPRAVSPEVLNRLHEAQAKFEGRTDPIPVTLG